MNKISNVFLKIFSDFWDKFKTHKPKYASTYFDRIIEKTSKCSDPQEGFVRYRCTHCGQDERVVGFTCKHSFCLRCGSIKAMKFVEEIKAKLYPEVDYRHLTLTLHEVFWKVFYKHHWSSEIFDRLYQAAWDCIQDVFQTYTHNMKIEVGAIMVIHVTGRDSAYNVHLHILLPMGCIEMISGKWIDIPRVPYNLLHMRWQKYLLEMLEDFDKSDWMKETIASIKEKYKKGFVANLDERILPKGGGKLAKYLAKYLFSPSISVKRIIKYDEKNEIVEYVYQDHQTHKLETARVSVMDFIGRMVQ
ncbi:MAG: transposase zinc-binding domain-containing protein [Oligoflexia bacterium]|nr:transposase zinc-binding domain-containing protein [Oligoflexia bacterium]